MAATHGKRKPKGMTSGQPMGEVGDVHLRPVTDAQRDIYADVYCQCLDPIEALRLSGMLPVRDYYETESSYRKAVVNAIHRSRTDKELIARVKNRLSHVADDCGITRNYLIAQQMAIAADARLGTERAGFNPVTKQFEPTGEIVKDLRTASMAVSAVAKMAGLDTPDGRQQATVVVLPAELVDVTDCTPPALPDSVRQGGDDNADVPEGD